MQKFSAIFLATLLCLNVISTLRLSPIDASLLPSNSIRAQLTSMLVQVQMTQTPKTIQAFLEQIRGMMDKLVAEQKSHQEISDKMVAQCNSEDDFRKNEVNTAQTALDAGNAARTQCDNSLKASQKDLPELTSAKSTYESELKKASEQRDAENKSFLQRKQEYEDAIAFLKDFIAYVSNKLGSTLNALSFVQKSETLLRHATKLGLLREAVPVLIALASHQEVPTTQSNYGPTANNDVAGKLKSTLNDLLNRLNNDWTTLQNTEQAAATAFSTLSSSLTTSISTLGTNIDKLNTQIQNMTKCVNDEDVVINTAQGKLTRNQGLKDSAVKMCAQFAKQFVEATNSRVDEIKTITEILVLIEKRFGAIPEALKEYLKSVENGWVQYQNSSQFKAFVQYEQNHTQGNTAGANLVATTNILGF